jgi:hypothetical protein
MRFFVVLGQIFENIYTTFKTSRLARVLLLIVLLKAIVFYGFLKGFLYPRYLKPKWESDEHRSKQVLEDLLNKPNTYFYD